MEDQQRIQQLLSEINGKPPQPLLPVYAPIVQEDNTDEWDLRQLLAVVRRRAVVIGGVAIAVSAAVSLWTLSLKPKYEAKFRLLIEPATAQNRYSGLTTPRSTPEVRPEFDYDTQIQVLQSSEITAPIVKQLSKRYPDMTDESLVANLSITHIEETKILDVSYQDTHPNKTQVVAQHLAKGYLQHSQEDGQTNLRQGIKFVDDQLPQLQARVNSLQKQVQQFQQQTNFADPQIRTQQLSQQASAIELQRLDTAKKLAEAQALYATLQKQTAAQVAGSPTWDPTLRDASDAALREPLDVAPAVQLSQIYQKLTGQLRDTEIKIATEATKSPKNTKAIQLLQQEQMNLRTALRQEGQRVLGNKQAEVTNRISLLQARASKVDQAQTSLTQQVNQLPTLIRSYTDLQRQLKVATDSLYRFLEKRESLQVEIAQKENAWKLIAAPQLPETPISPNVKRNLIFGVIAGLLAGIGAALLAERLSNVFHSPDELKEVTKLPVLGRIPFHKNLKQLAPITKTAAEKKTAVYKVAFRNIKKDQRDSDFQVLEAFRSLHTNIHFHASDTPISSLVISSAEHADGKSTVAINLAQAAAAMGQRVLLVDADLRRPQLHTLLDLQNEQGLSNIVFTDLPVLKVIQRSPLSENLFVLTSGQILPEPTKLLSSKKMHNIVEQLRQQFDLIIYDTAPILGLADSSLIATHTTGILLVTRIGKTDRSVLRQALEQLKLSRTTVLGMVCNGVKNFNTSIYNY